jgi:hypothetical protein
MSSGKIFKITIQTQSNDVESKSNRTWKKQIKPIVQSGDL